MQEMTYTISEFARQTGITVRTLRFYEEVELLVPKTFNDAGHRLYGIEELKKLQQIQSLKFVGYTLQDIQKLLRESMLSHESFEESLSMQHKLLAEKRDEIDRAIDAIETIQTLLQQEQELDWTLIISFLHGVQREEESKEWMKEHFSEDMVNRMYRLSKEERRALNIGYGRSIIKIRAFVKNNVSPQSEEAKTVAREMMSLTREVLDDVDEFFEVMRENGDEITKSMDQFRFPEIFTEEEDRFLDKVFEVLGEEMDDSESEDKAP
ncbi:MerR family transcriptional regulator [Shouchella lonarensis]|uniref:Transcriptional regulator, MerR family n=1 Tax=Shouchella lonarensis TaxID=1464122 RepID=A0A1G6MII8_9BACI|nr:MerR family transcriptional regulator [Shouchella lonarensis]SDC55342.1 transcriptional regulator, MerR family [Shouchella lonarensis]